MLDKYYSKEQSTSIDELSSGITFSELKWQHTVDYHITSSPEVPADQTGCMEMQEHGTSQYIPSLVEASPDHGNVYVCSHIH